MTLVSEFRLMSLSVLYDLMYPVSVLTNVLSILDTFNTGVTVNVLVVMFSFSIKLNKPPKTYLTLFLIKLILHRRI